MFKTNIVFFFPCVLLAPLVSLLPGLFFLLLYDIHSIASVYNYFFMKW